MRVRLILDVHFHKDSRAEESMVTSKVYVIYDIQFDSYSPKDVMRSSKALSLRSARGILV